MMLGMESVISTISPFSPSSPPPGVVAAASSLFAASAMGKFVGAFPADQGHQQEPFDQEEELDLLVEQAEAKAAAAEVAMMMSSAEKAAALDEFQMVEEGSDLLRMLEQPLSVLTVLSISAIITTIALFFCGIPICMQIYRRGSTREISGFPFLMGFLGGTFWLRYGLMKSDLTMVTVNVVGVALMANYILFYMYFSRPRTNFLLQLLLVCSTILGMLLLVHIYQRASLNVLGFVCMTFNIMNFGAPLAGLRVVLRNRNCATLPLPLCVANLLVSSQWCLYGFLVQDIFIIIPNGAGMALALIQMALFLIFPRKHGQHAPLARVCPCLVDLEKGGVDDDDEEEREEEEEEESSGSADGNMENARKRKKKHSSHSSEKKKQKAESSGGGDGDNQFSRSGHGALPRNKFMNRQRIIDRSMLPQSRAACIEYLRTAGIYGTAGNQFNASVGSHATVDSWISDGAPPSQLSLSRMAGAASCLSNSHPDLYATITLAPPPYELTDSNATAANGGPAFTLQHQDSNQPSSSLLPAAPKSPPPIIGGRAMGKAIAAAAKSSPFFAADHHQFADERQPLTETGKYQQQQMEQTAQQQKARTGTGDSGVVIVRTLSAPDLMAEQNPQILAK